MRDNSTERQANTDGLLGVTEPCAVESCTEQSSVTRFGKMWVRVGDLALCIVATFEVCEHHDALLDQARPILPPQERI